MKHIFSCFVVMCAVVLASLLATDYLQFNDTARAALLVDFTISGNVKADGANLQGATVSLTGSQSQTTATDANGNYSFTVSAGGYYRVSVYKSGYSFNPTTQTFNNLQSSQTANFQNGVPLPAPRPLGLVAWYKGEGNANDSSGNAYNGTLLGGTTFATGKVGQAFSLDGVNDQVEVASNIVIDPTNTGALAAWVRFNQLPSDAGRNMAIINKSNLMSFFDLTAETDNRFRFNVGNGNSVSSTTVVQTGVWYFVVGAWDATGLRMYVNGVLENTNATQNVVRTPNGQALKIGEGPIGQIGGQFFRGLIDEAQVYNRPLSATDVLAIYNAGSAGIFTNSVYTPLASTGKIAWTNTRIGSNRIFTMNPDGSNQTLITPDPSENALYPDWSPDGSKIAFSKCCLGSTTQIYTMNANGSNQTNLTTLTGHQYRMPDWSPDGTKIVFVGTNSMYVMNADGSNQITLIEPTSPLVPNDPHWSPDGSKIYFGGRNGDNGEIFVMNADGTNPTPLTNDLAYDRQPAVSPDGTKIAFASNRTGDDEIFVMNADGSNPVNLSNNPAISDTDPAWSPDGMKISFTRFPFTSSEIYTMNANGNNQTRLTNDAFFDGYTDWQPVRANVPVSPVNGVRLTFANITQPGYIVAASFTQTQIPAFPLRYRHASPTQAYDISSSATYTGNVTVSFDVPNVANAVACLRLRVLHFENGAWTAANNATPTYNSSTQVCTVSQTGTSLGLFVLAKATAQAFDYEGDWRTDISIYRPSLGQWWINKSSDSNTNAFQFGDVGDKPVPADYDGDGNTDVAVFRPSTGFWYVLRSSNGTFFGAPFGNSTDKPAPADFDGDGLADFTIFRPSETTWYINKTTGGVQITQFGASGDIPTVADYDGDGQADISVFRANQTTGNGEWWMLRSSAGFFATVFGVQSDKPVQGDFTGDGRVDVAVWRPSNGNWFVLRSEDNSFFAAPFGVNGDVPTPGDYDGDGQFDFAVFRPSQTTWFILRSTQGTFIQGFGANGDIPTPSSYIP